MYTFLKSQLNTTICVKLHVYTSNTTLRQYVNAYNPCLHVCSDDRFSASFGYYGITFGVSSLSGDLYLNMFLLNIVEAPVQIIVSFLVNWSARGQLALVITCFVKSKSPYWNLCRSLFYKMSLCRQPMHCIP